MTTHKKPFPFPLIGMAITIAVLASGIIASFAVSGEKVRQLENRCGVINQELSLNSVEHKKIIESLGTMDKSLARIETKLEYIPQLSRSGFRARGEK